jgi:5-methylcytosine-specific restriction enzyme subunit McrC
MTSHAVRAWSSTVLELTAEQAWDLAARKVVQVAPESAGRWTITAGSRVGILVGDGWELRIRPKLDIPKLMFLILYAVDQSGWDDVAAEFEGAEDEIAGLAAGFSWFADRALSRGPLRWYVRVHERRDSLRGRVRFSDQIARSGGLPLPLEVSYDDFTADVVENRMLLTAANLLLRLPRVPARARHRLLHTRVRLQNVTPLRSWRGAKAPLRTRLNEHYAPALALAEFLFSALSLSDELLDRDEQRRSSATFVFNMNKVFEDFVFAALADSMRPYGGDVRPQDKEFFLDEGERLKLKPDIAWWRGDSCRAVLDAKYKAIDDGKLRHDDAYQMLAYCTAYGLRRGYLVYAQDSGVEATTHLVRNAGIEVVVESLDVEAEPDDLIAQVRRLAHTVAAGIASTQRRAA